MKKILNSLTLLAILLFFPQKVHAIDSNLGFGQIKTPPGVDKINAASGADIGILYFISNLITIFTVIMGIWTLFNVVLAGYIYISSSGDSKAHDSVRTQITNSVIGLILIVMTYTIGGLIGLIFFGDPAVVLSPTIPTVFD